jgi:hypothetical protein
MPAGGPFGLDAADVPGVLACLPVGEERRRPGRGDDAAGCGRRPERGLPVAWHVAAVHRPDGRVRRGGAGAAQATQASPCHGPGDAAALDAARTPVDQQTLYNRMFRADDSHLELLFAHGLAAAGPSPWELLLGEAMESRADMWRRQVQWAAEHGFGGRLALLERHGIDVSGVDPRRTDRTDRPETHATTTVRQPLHHAAWDGDLERIPGTCWPLGPIRRSTDDRFGTTPLGWAEHAYQTEAAELLRVQAPT